MVYVRPVVMTLPCNYRCRNLKKSPASLAGSVADAAWFGIKVRRVAGAEDIHHEGKAIKTIRSYGHSNIVMTHKPTERVRK